MTATVACEPTFDLRRVFDTAAAMHESLAAFDAALCTGADAARLVLALGRVERMCASARVRAALRVEECGSQREVGHRTAAELMAAATGTSEAQAQSTMTAAVKLGASPHAADAFASGELSEAQARTIAPAVAANPDAGADLVRTARDRSARDLAEEARRRRFEHVDPDELYAKQRKAREHRHWIGADGMVTGRYRLTPDAGAVFAARIDREVDRIFRATPKDDAEPIEAYSADALVNLVCGDHELESDGWCPPAAPPEPPDEEGGDRAGGAGLAPRGEGPEAEPSPPGEGERPEAGPPPAGEIGGGDRRRQGKPRKGRKGRRRDRKVDAVVVIDLPALLRGHVHEGERCHIVGVGPVPVSVARLMMDDAFIKAVLVDGVDIRKVKHFRRYRPAELQTALDLGALPHLNGIACADGCGRRKGLQWDHVDPMANGGATEYSNFAPRCGGDHRDKTERDRAAGLLDGSSPP